MWYVSSFPIHWKNVAAFELVQWNFPNPRPANGDWIIEDIRITTGSGASLWAMATGRPQPNIVRLNSFLSIPVNGFTPPIEDVEDLLSEDERCCLRRLTNHLRDHGAYYWRAIWLAETAPDRAHRLEKWKVGDQLLLDLVENTIYDFTDGYAVMPVVSGAETALVKPFEDRDVINPPVFTEYIEQIITVPARGVFAEAKLGHCNASEIIDPNRFWDWQTSPIPDDASEIAPISTDSRFQDPTKGLAATPFPQGIVNVVNPQSLPDPTGLNAAAGVMSALGPFRDMSGMQQLAQFLQTLSNNATQLAAQGLKNAAGGDKPGEKGGSGTGSTSNPATGGGTVVPPGKTPGGDLGGGSTPPPTPTPVPTLTPTPIPNPQPIPPPRRPTAISPKEKKLVFNFKYDSGQQMVGVYQVSLRDNTSAIEYIQDNRFDGTRTSLVEVTVPASVGSAIASVRGTVGSAGQSISTPPGLKAEDWSFEINTAGKSVADLSKVKGFDVVGKTKKMEFEITHTKEEGADSTQLDSKAVTVTGGDAVDVKVVTVKAEGATQWIWGNPITTKVGNVETSKTKGDVLIFDNQVQPSIEIVQ